VYAAVPAVVKLAEPLEIVPRLHPRSNMRWITDSWIVTLKPDEVHSILQGELDVRMMEFKSSCALGKVTAVVPDKALRRRLRAAMERIKVNIMRISCARRVIGVVDRVVLRD